MFLYFVDIDNIENQIVSEIPLREYQKELALDGCEGENVIIIAPTNSGKTWVACRIIQVRTFYMSLRKHAHAIYSNISRL